jgi:3-oxoadipate enol-lactonase
MLLATDLHSGGPPNQEFVIQEVWTAEYPEVAEQQMSTHNADRYLESDGARLRWRLEGSGPAVVLLHGWAMDLAYWDPLADLLAPQFTVLRFDRRGFGLSQGIPDIHSNVADMLALLDEAAIDRATLVGMSQGARLAIHFAIAHPERTRALVLDGAPALEAEPDLPLDQYRTLLQSDGRDALQAQIHRHPLMQLQTSEQSAHRLLSSVLSRYSGLDLLHPVMRRDKPEMGAITAPVLILNGSNDSTERRDAGRALRAAIPGAQRRELGNAGHLAMLDDPPSYARVVRDFCLALPP